MPPRASSASTSNPGMVGNFLGPGGTSGFVGGAGGNSEVGSLGGGAGGSHSSSARVGPREVSADGGGSGGGTPSVACSGSRLVSGMTATLRSGLSADPLVAVPQGFRVAEDV